MKIHIQTEHRVVRGGVSVRVPRIRLTGNGRDAEAARRELLRGLNAWALGLAKLGRLERELDNLHIHWNREGEGLEFVEEPTERAA